MKRVTLIVALVILGCTSSSNRTQIVDTPYAGPEGAIRGIVVARDGTPLPGVTVTLHAPNGGDRATVTAADGTYAFFNVPAGNRRVSAELAGFGRFDRYVDGASYTNVRRFLSSNLKPPADAVRIEEMVNYFTYRYPPPADGRPVAISSEVAGCPWAPEHRLLRVGLQARTVEQWKLAPNNLVFLLDVSGSMSPPDRLPLVVSAMRMLVD